MPSLHTRYDEKADIFSMGLILFEMWHPPFATLSERALTFQQVRNEGVLPKAFEESTPTLVTSLIR